MIYCEKFSVEIAGYDANIGFTQWANKPCKEDAQVRLSRFILDYEGFTNVTIIV